MPIGKGTWIYGSPGLSVLRVPLQPARHENWKFKVLVNKSTCPGGENFYEVFIQIKQLKRSFHELNQ